MSILITQKNNSHIALITSLLELEKFPADLLAREYHQRWSQLAIGGEGQASTTQIIHGAEQTTQTSLPLSPKPYLGEVENTIDELKIHHKARKTHIRSQRPREVVQEVYGWLLGHWSVRVLMFQAATTAGVPPLLLSFYRDITGQTPKLFLSFNAYSKKNYPFFRLVNRRDSRYVVTRTSSPQ